MANYLNKYIGTYRVVAEYDITTNDFPREYDGSLSENDLFIPCKSNSKIYHFGGSKLVFYCPSKKRGHNIVRDIFADKKSSLIYDFEESDEELSFKFDSKNLEQLVQYFEPKVNGASIRPHSTKNLPKTSYMIPKEDLDKYNEAVKDVPFIQLTQSFRNYMNTLYTKKKDRKWYQSDMRLKGLKGKNYIHSLNLWNEYIDFLNKTLRG